MKKNRKYERKKEKKKFLYVSEVKMFNFDAFFVKVSDFFLLALA